MLVTGLFILNGCGPSEDAKMLKHYQPPPDSDVTTSAKYNFSSFSGTIWKTKVKVALADVKAYSGKWNPSLLVSKHFDQTDPDYTPGGDRKVIAVIPVGTRVRMERLMKDNGVWGGLWVIGSLEDGTNSQKTVFLDEALLADNRFISPGVSS